LNADQPGRRSACAHERHHAKQPHKVELIFRAGARNNFHEVR
jgi:hypothetical protein